MLPRLGDEAFHDPPLDVLQFSPLLTLGSNTPNVHAFFNYAWTWWGPAESIISNFLGHDPHL